MEVLTPAQAQSLKELTIQELAYSHLIDPTMGFTMPSFAKSAFLNLNLTKEQNEAVHLLGKEASDWFHQYHQTIADKTLSILTPQQKAGLRAEALGPLGPNDPLDLLTVNLKGESKPLAGLLPCSLSRLHSGERSQRVGAQRGPRSGGCRISWEEARVWPINSPAIWKSYHPMNSRG